MSRYIIKYRHLLLSEYEHEIHFDDDKIGALKQFYKMYKVSKENLQAFKDNDICFIDLDGEPINTVYKEIGVYGYDLNGDLHTIHKFELRTAYDEIISSESLSVEDIGEVLDVYSNNKQN